MTVLFGPKVMNLAGSLNPKHGGYEAVLIWAESGCQLYTWHNYRFFTVDIYTCMEMLPATVLDLVCEPSNHPSWNTTR